MEQKIEINKNLKMHVKRKSGFRCKLQISLRIKKNLSRQRIEMKIKPTISQISC